MSKTKFKDLTPEQKEYLRYVYHSEKTHKEKTDVLSKKFGVNERTIRKWWQNLDLKKQSYDLPPQLRKALEREINKDSKVLLISSTVALLASFLTSTSATLPTLFSEIILLKLSIILLVSTK